MNFLHTKKEKNWGVWIDLTDERQEGRFESRSGRTPSFNISQHWSSGRPSGNKKKNCVFVFQEKLFDHTCENSQPFVCEGANAQGVPGTLYMYIYRSLWNRLLEGIKFVHESNLMFVVETNIDLAYKIIEIEEKIDLGHALNSAMIGLFCFIILVLLIGNVLLLFNDLRKAKECQVLFW